MPLTCIVELCLQQKGALQHCQSHYSCRQHKRLRVFAFLLVSLSNCQWRFIAAAERKPANSSSDITQVHEQCPDLEREKNILNSLKGIQQ